VPHHVFDIVRLDAQSHELGLEELAETADAEAVSSFITLSEQAGLEIESVNELPHLFLSHRSGDIVHLVSNDRRVIGEILGRNLGMEVSSTSTLQVQAPALGIVRGRRIGPQKIRCGCNRCCMGWATHMAM